MSNAFFTPFNHQPDSTTARNADYTIPSDKYARLTYIHTQSVQTNQSDDRNITIDGDIWIPQLHYGSNNYDANDSAVIIHASGVLRIIASSANFYIRNYYGNTSTTTSITAANTWEEFFVTVGDEIYLVTDINEDFTAVLKPDINVFQPIWVPPGTVIATDGSEYLVEEYNVYS